MTIGIESFRALKKTMKKRSLKGVLFLYVTYLKFLDVTFYHLMGETENKKLDLILTEDADR